jgi:tRNA uridine 5-carboxymethylaminomethyl modification enzyme
MPCNPNIGGSSKGHLVREIDALGGEMAKNIDKTFIQSRMLNKSKGPAVYSLRAQADKRRYSAEMLNTLRRVDNLHIRQAEIVDIIVNESKRAAGVVTSTSGVARARAVVLCTGTYLKARCLCGDTIDKTGPNGLKSAMGLSESLDRLGIRIKRFKTGTPARIDRRSIDYTQLEIQHGDVPVIPFSFDTRQEDLRREQIPCYVTYTNESTHAILRENLHHSPMYSGVIEGVGARYCPSIEDKIVRFADRERHQVFVEPEGEDSGEMYISGMSTSMPEDVQEAMYRTLPGFEKARVTRLGYAIEYDCVDGMQLDCSLMFKHVSGLFSAGQINGSSGYEEAAAQGLIAGINAARLCQNKPPITISRSEGYIGVLIDDLVTKGTNEPYRMLTSRAEYRLLLRQDNADQRLMKKGYEAGLISRKRYEQLITKIEAIEKEIDRVETHVIPPGDKINRFLEEHSSSRVITGVLLAELIRRPELSYDMLAPFDTKRSALPAEVAEQVNICVKYRGYILRQSLQVEQFKRSENTLLPIDIDYFSINGLRIEARQKLNTIKPLNLGMASKIAGVSPADLSVLAIWLKARRA